MVTRPGFPSGAGGVEEGTMFFNTSDKKLYVYTGDPSWEAILYY